jgi:argininosuccinate lyase
VLATSSSLLTTFCKLAEDLEIWSSSEFDYVDLDDGYTRASVLMPQKRNPYALSIIRGASGVLIGRLAGFLAVTKSPSARSDNLIYAYGEVPRALDLAVRIARLSAGVVRTLRVNKDRLAEEVRGGYTQATDLAEYLVQSCDVDYRTAYLIVGRTVRAASRAGVRGVAITGEMIDEAAVEHRGTPLGVAGRDLSAVLDPWQIVLSRDARGGASPDALARMTTSLRARLDDLAASAADRLAGYDTAEDALLAAARQGATPTSPGGAR